MTSLYILGGGLIILQLLVAKGMQRLQQSKNWFKYMPSIIIFFIGVLCIPLSNLFASWLSILLATTGITMVITTLLTIPIITLFFD